MNFKTTLILLVLLAVVGAYFIVFERGSESTYEIQQRRLADDDQGTAAFADLAAADITRITLRRRGDAQPSAVLARDDGQWVQVEPVRFPLAAAGPQGLAREAANLRWIESFEPADPAGDSDAPTLADVGLDHPRLTLTIETADASHRIALGKRSAGGRGYVRIDDQSRVLVVADALHASLLDRRVDAWRDTSLQAPPISQLDRVELRSGDETIVARKLDGRWFLDDAGTQRASEASLSTLLTSLGSVAIREFIADAPDDLGVYGLAQPRLELTIIPPTIDDQQPRRSTLRVGAAADLRQQAYYATWTTPRTSSDGQPSQVVFTIGQSAVEPLDKSLSDLRDPRIVVTDAKEVREVHIDRPGGDRLTLQRTGRGWVFGEPAPPFKLDHQAAEDLLAALVAARAQSYDTEPPSDRPPALTVELYTGADEQPERIELFGPRESDDATYLSLREGETVGYLVPAADLEPLLAPVESLREKTILSVAPDRLTRVELDQPDQVRLVFTRDANGDSDGDGDRGADADATWRLEGSQRFESAMFDRLLASLAPLDVETWITTLQSFEPNATLTLHLDDGSTRTLAVETDTRRATMPQTPMFALPESLVDLLTAEYRDRLALPLTLAQIGSVTLTRGDQVASFHRDANRQYVNADGERVDQAVAAGVFDTLAGLRVQRWLSAAPDADETPIRIAIEPRDGAVRTLLLWPDSGVGRFEDADRWFELSERDATKLAAAIADE